jgi:DNA invertase Pin-like site-specific DNA recombinase
MIMRKDVLYARTSLSDQDLEGQYQAIRESVKGDDTVVGSYGDRSTTPDDPRPSQDQAPDQITDGPLEALMVRYLDCLAQSPEALARLQSMLRERGVNLVLVQNSAEI